VLVLSRDDPGPGLRVFHSAEAAGITNLRPFSSWQPAA